MGIEARVHQMDLGMGKAADVCLKLLRYSYKIQGRENAMVIRDINTKLAIGDSAIHNYPVIRAAIRILNNNDVPLVTATAGKHRGLYRAVKASEKLAYVARLERIEDSVRRRKEIVHFINKKKGGLQ